MTVIQRYLIAGLVLAALVGGVYVLGLQLEAAQARADYAAERARQAEQHLTDASATIKQLRDREARLATLRRESASLQAALERSLSNREAEIRRLQRENADLREWADRPLPVAVAGMRQRPALTGAAAYRQYLSDAEPLHAAGGGADHQRRAEPPSGAP